MSYDVCGPRVAVRILSVLPVVAGVLGLTPGCESQAGQPKIDWGEAVPPKDWTRMGDAPPDTELQLFLGLSRDQSGMFAYASAVTDPGSEDYGSYESIDELASRFGATAATVEGVEDALAEAGVDDLDLDATRAFARVTLDVSQASALLGIGFGKYETVDDGTTLDAIAPDRLPSTPPPGWKGVELVRGLLQILDTGDAGSNEASSSDQAGSEPDMPRTVTAFPVEGGTPFRTGTAVGCSEARKLETSLGPSGLMPNQILTAYGIDALHDAGFRGQDMRLALVEAEGEFKQSDLDTFTECFEIDPITPDVHGTSTGPGQESTLDIQVFAMVAPEAQIDVFYNDIDTGNLWSFAPFLSAPLNVEEVPDIVSVSFGLCELELDDDDVATLPVIEFVLAMSASAGVGYYVASGDSGSSDCFQAGTDMTMDRSIDYPSASPWVTAVGGTNLTLNEDNTIADQGVWNTTSYFQSMAPAGALNGGGGGASRHLDRPEWQRGSDMPGGSTRMTPDVALFADPLPGWVVFCTTQGCRPDDGFVTQGGTSASTPLLAAGMGLVTQAVRTFAPDRADPGFAAPLIYALARDEMTYSDVFWDVEAGDNDVFGAGCCDAGPGYDRASGWGSLDIGRLADTLVEDGLE